MKGKVKTLLLGVVMAAFMTTSLFFNGIEAYAEGGVTIRLHYNRADGNYNDWSVWFWEEGKDGADYAFYEEDGDMVATMESTPGTMNVGFIVRTPDWGKDIDKDQFIDISEMVSGTVDVFVESGVEGYTEEYGADAVKGTKVKNAKYDGNGNVNVLMTGEIEGDAKDAFSIKGKDGEIAIKSVSFDGNLTYTLSLQEELILTRKYALYFEGQGNGINMPEFYSTDEFESKYTYTGTDLGAVWTKDSTTFKVWAPTAEAIEVRFYETGDGRVKNMTEEIPMTEAENGTWVLTKDGDLNGVYYTYHVTIDGVGKETCDPYARTTGVNGERAMVIDLASTNPEGWDQDKNPHAGEPVTDAIIYEAHVRDLTTEEGAGIAHPGKFLGVCEADTATENGIPTGLSHIKELGATHLHILPFYDFGSVDENKSVTGIYNWGYDPVNYNVPEGSYSTDAANGEVRVREVKEMVKSLHDNGISVVMDVVYNHVQSSSGFCFNILVPGYFSRITPEGANSNGSGCGNDTASERSMVRKYIVDSVNYWADEYHIDGFRFDLVGLIDVDTINEIVKTVHEKHPDVIFYGEGWSMSTLTTKEDVVLATQTNASLTPGFAYFNDTIRDGIKGSVFDTGKGFVSGAKGNAPKISRCFLGMDKWCPSPSQTINYASCHDNNTLFDRLTLSCPDASKEDIVKMNKLSAAIYLTGEGIPFMQAGEEMLRSKVNDDGTFNSNSYNAGDKVNTIHYSDLLDETVKDVFEYYKGLISFRKAHKALRLETAEEVGANVSEIVQNDTECLTFVFDGKNIEGEISDGLFVVLNAEPVDEVIELPEGEWKVCVNGEKAGTEVLSVETGSVQVKAGTAMVLVQGENEVKESLSTSPVSGEGRKLGLAVSLVTAAVLILAGLFGFVLKKK